MSTYADILKTMDGANLSREIEIQTRLYRTGNTSPGKLDAVYEER